MTEQGNNNHIGMIDLEDYSLYNMKRIYIRNTARRTFKDYKTCQDVDRVKSKIKESRKVFSTWHN